MDEDIEYRRALTQRLERIENKLNEIVGFTMTVTTFACVAGAYYVVSDVTRSFLAKEASETLGVVAGVITYFAVWLSLHKKIFS